MNQQHHPLTALEMLNYISWQGGSCLVQCKKCPLREEGQMPKCEFNEKKRNKELNILADIERKLNWLQELT